MMIAMYPDVKHNSRELGVTGHGFMDRVSGGAPPLKRDNALSFSAWQDLLEGGAKIAAFYGRNWHASESSEPMAVTLLGVDGQISVSSPPEGAHRCFHGACSRADGRAGRGTVPSG
jgi:hypothetical protein